MTSRPQGAQVRAFSVDGARGNPSFVFATGPDEHSDAEACIAMAARQQCEVTWLRSAPGQAGIGLRFFTAGGEIAFCGHGTLAAAAWLADRHAAGPAHCFEIAGTALQVVQDASGRWSYGQEAAGFETLAAARDLHDAERALGLPPGRLACRGGVRLARSAGALREKLLLDVPDAADLHAIALHAATRDALCERLRTTGLYVFSVDRDARTPRVMARHFPLHAGEHEDMATGGIAPTVVRYAQFSDAAADVVIEQGGPDCRHSRLVVSRGASGSAHRVAGECVVGADEAVSGTLVTQAHSL